MEEVSTVTLIAPAKIDGVRKTVGESVTVTLAVARQLEVAGAIPPLDEVEVDLADDGDDRLMEKGHELARAKERIAGLEGTLSEVNAEFADVEAKYVALVADHTALQGANDELGALKEQAVADLQTAERRIEELEAAKPAPKPATKPKATAKDAAAKG